MRSHYLSALGLVLLLASQTFAETDDDVLFEEHVRPILKAHCLECHGEGEEIGGELDLRLRHFILAGGDSGPDSLKASRKKVL